MAAHAAGVPVHEAVLDQEQLLAARHVVLDVLVEHALAVPAQVPLAVFHEHPRSAAHMVLLMLFSHGVGVPLHARVALLQVQPGAAVQVVLLVLSAQAAGEPMQLAPVDAVHAQPGWTAHELDVVCEVHGYTVPEQVPAAVGQLQPGSAAQAVALVFRLQARGVPVHVPPAGVSTRQPGTDGQVDVDTEAHDARVGVPAQCGPIENVTVGSG